MLRKTKNCSSNKFVECSKFPSFMGIRNKFLWVLFLRTFEFGNVWI